MKRIPCILFIGTAVLLQSRLVTAQADDPPEITSEFDLNTFTPASTPEDGYVIDYAEVLDSGQFGFDLLAQIDDDPLTWQRTSDSGSYEETEIARERLILLHAGGAVGLFDYGQIAVNIPIVMDNGEVNSKAGIGDLRLVPKGAYRFTGNVTKFGIALLVPMSFPTGNSKHLIGEGSMSVAPTLALDAIFGKLRVGLNAGYYYRSEQERDLLRGSELQTGLGFSFDILKSAGTLRALAEVNASTQVGDMMGRQSTPVVVMGGVKHRFQKGLGWLASAGAGVTPGVGAPDFRAIIGLDYVRQKSTTPVKKEEPKIDSDGDGVLDSEDNCPDKLEDFDGFEDGDGCPEDDNDGDGIVDSKDACPTEPENKNGLEDFDGCPEFDRDDDGVMDGLDNCPDEAEDRDGFADNDGCPEDDNDLDNVKDASDKCPDLPESANGYKDSDGCPDYLHRENDQIVLDRRIKFVKDEDNLKERSYPVLDELAEVLIANPAWTEIEFIVHTSGRGNDSAQQTLSENRARALVRLLIHSGVLPERLIGTGKGNSEPLAPPTTVEGRISNARVQIIIRKGVSK